MLEVKTETKHFSDCFIPLFIESNVLQSLKVNFIVVILLLKFHIPFNRKRPGVLQNLFFSFARLILCFEAINKAVIFEILETFANGFWCNFTPCFYNSGYNV